MALGDEWGEAAWTARDLYEARSPAPRRRRISFALPFYGLWGAMVMIVAVTSVVSCEERPRLVPEPKPTEPAICREAPANELEREFPLCP